jgi:hypothetical protein
MDTDAQIAEIEELLSQLSTPPSIVLSDGRLVRWVTISVVVTVLSALCFAFMPFLAAYGSLLSGAKINAIPISVPVAITTPVTPVIAEVIPDTAQAPDSLCRVALTDLHQATARVTELIALRRSIEDIPIVASSDPAQRPRAHSTRGRTRHAADRAPAPKEFAEKDAEPAEPATLLEKLFGPQPKPL